MKTLLLSAAFALSLGAAARAATTLLPNDPRTAINALNTPGDGKATFIITASGSYYLEANLLGEAGKAGIRVEASEVQIDLMGFHLEGASVGTHAITETADLLNIAIRNGRISHWIGVGINFGTTFGVDVRDLGVRFSGVGAISLGQDALVDRCIVQIGYGYGISARAGATISQSKVSAVGGKGIAVGDASLVRDCTVRNCGDDGIEVNFKTVVQGCTVTGNYRGINGNGSLIIESIVSGNLTTGVSLSEGTVRNCEIAYNVSHGISFNVVGNRAIGNRVFDNGGDGIRAQVGARIEDNEVHSHFQGVGIRTLGTGSFVAKNTLFTNATHLSVPNSGNFVGPLVSTNATNGRNDPWANIYGN